MKLLTIKAYEFHELESDARSRVIYWLDQDPLEVARIRDWDDEGEEMEEEYFSDMTDLELLEHFEINGYLFDYRGRPVHHYLEGEG